MKKIVFVIGMHRSGTSGLAGSIHKMGYSIGLNKMSPAVDNPKGFFENKTIVKFNDRLLEKMGSSWSHNTILDEGWLEYLNIVDLKNELHQIIKSEFGEDIQIIIKDPRLCIVFPIWQHLLKDELHDIKIILIQRQHDSVLASLQQRNKFPLEKSLKLYLEYNYQAEKHTREHDRIFISFEDLTSKQSQVFDNIKAFLDIDDSVIKLGELKKFLTVPKKKNGLTKSFIKENSKLKWILKYIKPLDTFFKNNRKTLKTTFKALDTHFEEYKSRNSFFTLNGTNRNCQLIGTSMLNENTHVLPNQYLMQGINSFSIDVEPNATITLHPTSCTAYYALKIFNQDNHSSIDSNLQKVLINHGNLFIGNEETTLSFIVPSSCHQIAFELELFSTGPGVLYYLPHLKYLINIWIQELQEENHKKINLITSNLEEANSENEKYSKEAKIIKSVVDEQREHISAQKQTILSYKQTVSSLEDQLNNDERIKTYEEKIKETLQISGEQKLDIKQKNILLDELQSQLNQQAELSGVLSVYKTKIDDLKEEIKLNKTLIQDHQNQRESFRTKELDLVRLEVKYQHAVSELSKNEKIILELNQNINAVKIDFEIKKEEIHALEKEQIRDRMNIDSLNAVLEERHKKIMMLEQEVTYLHKNNDTVLKESYKLLEEAEKEKHYLAEKNHEFLDINKNLQTELEKSKRIIQENETARAELERNIEARNSENIIKKLEIDVLKQNIEEKELAVKNLKLKTATSNPLANSEELNRLQKEIQVRENNISQLESEINSNKASNEQIQSDLAKLNHHINELEHSLKVKEEEIFHKDKAIELFKIHNTERDRDLEAVRKSISYKLGFGITSPARWLFDNTVKKNIEEDNMEDDSTIFEVSNVETETEASKIEDESSQGNYNEIIDIDSTDEVMGDESISIDSTKDESLNDNSLNNEKAEIIWEDDEQKQGNDRAKVLFISPHIPDFDTSSGGKRATRMLSLLAEEFDVYAFTLGNKPERHVNKLSENGVIVIHTNNFRQVKKRIPHFHTIIFAWYYTYFDCGQFLSLYPGAKIIVDTVDVHWVREERSIGLLEHLTQESFEANKLREIEVYKNADIIWAVTENDKGHILKEIPDADVRLVSNVHDNHVHKYQDSNNNKILFFGGFNHYPNISAVQLLAKEIFPIVKAEIPNAELIIAGSNAGPEVIELADIEGIEYKGFIDEDKIEDLYKETFIVAAPLLAGAGIKGKICEAIAFMKPVVTNSIGNEGINLTHEVEGLIQEDTMDLAKAIIRAMKREIDLTKMTALAQDKLSHIVSSETVRKNMYTSILPEISICIVTWNRIELLQRCIQSIEGNTNYPYYKIIVHSNGCEDGTQEYLSAAAKINKKIIPVLSKENEVFVKPNNAMMMLYDQNDVVLVNNDVYVTEGWLTNLYAAAYSDADIGIAGSKILYPDGKLQEFGSELYENGTGRNIGKWDDPDKEEYKQLTRVGYVSGCSLYIKRKTINKIGVFDEQFHPCYCEDSDLCYTAWENGIETVVTPKSIIFHDEGGTSGTDEESGFKAYQKINFEKFLAKHKHNLTQIAEKIKALN